MSTPEVVIGWRWLISVLSGDSTLAGYAPGGVWRSMAPPSTATPFVVVAHQAGSDVTTANGVRLMVTSLYQVKAVGPSGDDGEVILAAQQIDTLLGGNQGSRNVTATDGLILSCVRQSPLAIDEPPINGEIWTNIGGLYQLQVQQTD